MKHLLAVLPALTFLPAVADAAVGAGNLCAADEKTLFACTTGDKLIAVCGAPDLSPRSGYLQLRYGDKERLELVWPAPTYPPKQVVKGKLLYSGTIGSYLRVINRDVGFTVYSAAVDGGQGLTIDRNGALVKKLPCRATSVSRLWDAPVPVKDMIAVSGIE